MNQKQVFEINGKPIYLDQFGNSILIKGVVYGNGDNDIVLYLPDDKKATTQAEWFADADQWREILKQTDDPEMYIKDPNGGTLKAIVRKNSRQVDEWMRWAVWRRDKFTCVYCGETAKAMTVDHVLAQELGGETTVENMVTSCRWCNKQKANKTIQEWFDYCKKKGIPFKDYNSVPGIVVPTI
jgi:hypothetical protein